MNKQTESLTAPPKVGNLANLSFSARLNLRETMNQTEAQEWIRRYKTKAKELGNPKALMWWKLTLEDIAKRRGQQAAEELRNRMNLLKDKK
jgi:hypothetical protein